MILRLLNCDLFYCVLIVYHLLLFRYIGFYTLNGLNVPDADIYNTLSLCSERVRISSGNVVEEEGSQMTKDVTRGDYEEQEEGSPKKKKPNNNVRCTPRVKGQVCLFLSLICNSV